MKLLRGFDRIGSEPTSAAATQCARSYATAGFRSASKTRSSYAKLHEIGIKIQAHVSKIRCCPPPASPHHGWVACESHTHALV